MEFSGATARNGSGRNGFADEHSMAELTKQLAEQASALGEKEIELAKAELTAKGKRLGMGAGAFAGGGAFGFYAMGAITAAAILALSLVVPAWLAALIVGVIYAACAGVLAIAGKKQVDRGTPPVPEQAIESSKADIRHTTARVKEARNRE